MLCACCRLSLLEEPRWLALKPCDKIIYINILPQEHAVDTTYLFYPLAIVAAVTAALPQGRRGHLTIIATP
jgi:hypothetical protein